MPTVPSTNNVVALNQPQMRPTLVDNTYKMMAAAELHQAGMLFEDRAQPTKDAIAKGDMDPVGINSTDFNKAPR